MITNFEIDGQGMIVMALKEAAVGRWCDIMNPTLNQRQLIAHTCQIVLPQHHEMHQLEYSNRFYEENNTLYMSVSMITKAAPVPESHVVTFILNSQQLITLRYSEVNPIQHFIQELSYRHYHCQNHFDIFHLLLVKVLGTVADVFELIGAQTDELALKLTGSIGGKTVSQHSKLLNKTLREINYLQSLLAKSYQSLSTLMLLLSYYRETGNKLFGDVVDFETLDKDISSMGKHGEYLTQKLGFQLQSTLGLINMEQTHIIKIFTVLAMVFMPPTLIASIYGMNFHFLPELSLRYGYPVVLCVMVVSSLLPYGLFKKKRWI